MVLQQMMTTTQVARLFGAETPEEIRTRQGYLAQLRFRRQWHQAGYTLDEITPLVPQIPKAEITTIIQQHHE